MLGTYALLDSGPFVFEITSPNFFFGLVGLMLLGFTFSLASNSARLALADASGGLVFSYFVGEPISVALKLIEGIFVPNPVEALVVYCAFFMFFYIPIFFPLIKGFIMFEVFYLVPFPSYILIAGGAYFFKVFSGESIGKPPLPSEPVLTAS